ncbi:hypothetical protein V8G54_027274 [Vigna mungo]|uniref:Uncharacterized protein n=1 Tax=Vigna mungo TaxID=3915 RepID=A0AAQ3N2C6_VIGMU
MNPKIGNDSWPFGASHLCFAKITSSPSGGELGRGGLGFQVGLFRLRWGSRATMVVRVAIVSSDEDATPSSIGNKQHWSSLVNDSGSDASARSGASNLLGCSRKQDVESRRHYITVGTISGDVFMVSSRVVKRFLKQLRNREHLFANHKPPH